MVEPWDFKPSKIQIQHSAIHKSAYRVLNLHCLDMSEMAFQEPRVE